MKIPNDVTQIYPFCKLNLVVKTFEHLMNLPIKIQQKLLSQRIRKRDYILWGLDKYLQISSGHSTLFSLIQLIQIIQTCKTIKCLITIKKCKNVCGYIYIKIGIPNSLFTMHLLIYANSNFKLLVFLLYKYKNRFKLYQKSKNFEI